MHKNETLIVSAIILITTFLHLPSLTQPLGPDQGVMSVIGTGILEGKIPYRDFWEMGSPAIFFTYALMFKIFGRTMTAIPITDIFVNIITIYLIYILSKKIWDKKTGYASALFYAIFSSGVRFGMHSAGDVAFGTFWYIAQRETFILPLIVSSIYFAISSENSNYKLFKLTLSGFFAGLAFVYKFPSLIFLFCVFIYLNYSFIIIKKKETLKSYFVKNAFLISGFVIAIIPFTLFFVLKGAFVEMTDIIFGYVYTVYGQLNHDILTLVSVGLSHTFFLVQENFILWIFFISSSIYILINNRTKENLLLVLWGIASIVFIISHREFFGYHYLIILPPFSILSGYGIATVLAKDFSINKIFTTEMGKAIIIIVIIINFISFITITHSHYTKFFFYYTGKISKDEYYSNFNAYPKHDYSFPADYQVSNYIKNNTDTNDLIFILGGIEGVIYFLTNRKSPSRFVFSWILFYFAHGKTKEAELYREELLADLITKKPKYIVTIKSLDSYSEFIRLYTFINENYRLEKIFPDDRFVYAYNRIN